MKVPLVPQPCQHLVLSIFFTLAILDEYVVVSYCSFICISLMINDVKHLLMFPLAICIFSFINFKYLALLLLLWLPWWLRG